MKFDKAFNAFVVLYFIGFTGYIVYVIHETRLPTPIQIEPIDNEQ